MSADELIRDRRLAGTYEPDAIWDGILGAVRKKAHGDAMFASTF